MILTTGGETDVDGVGMFVGGAIVVGTDTGDVLLGFDLVGVEGVVLFDSFCCCCWSCWRHFALRFLNQTCNKENKNLVRCIAKA